GSLEDVGGGYGRRQFVTGDGSEADRGGGRPGRALGGGAQRALVLLLGVALEEVVDRVRRLPDQEGQVGGRRDDWYPRSDSRRHRSADYNSRRPVLASGRRRPRC